ncbi:hypothetical protein F383_11693 [Gossypium arboreum]|uniref:Uncharacterized protein n=1 Tax=Gossypium arboreum TaxID=29729 RepID=A0A0B0ND97_GOSAR|nr:hypothetical protein F383_11693 [Gossypium arboreum]
MRVEIVKFPLEPQGNKSDIHAITRGSFVRASVRPCLGHGIGIETSASVRHV